MPELPVKLELWVQTLPEEVQEVVRAKPPTICYRSVENDGHFWLEGITENDGIISYTVMHGSDSFLPGFRVYHIDPDSLMPCVCGKWERPATSQIEAANKVVEAMLKASTLPHPDES